MYYWGYPHPYNTLQGRGDGLMCLVLAFIMESVLCAACSDEVPDLVDVPL